MKIKKTLIKILVLSFTAVAITACSSGSDSSSNKNDYVWENGVCKSRKDKWIVENSRCQNGTSGGYYIGSNGQCYNSSNTVVASTYCGITTGGTTTVSAAYYDSYGRCIYNNQVVDYWYCGGQQQVGYYPGYGSYYGGGYSYGGYMQAGVQLDGTAALLGLGVLGLISLL